MYLLMPRMHAQCFTIVDHAAPILLNLLIEVASSTEHRHKLSLHAFPASSSQQDGFMTISYSLHPS